MIQYIQGQKSSLLKNLMRQVTKVIMRFTLNELQTWAHGQASQDDPYSYGNCTIFLKLGSMLDLFNMLGSLLI